VEVCLLFKRFLNVIRDSGAHQIRIDKKLAKKSSDSNMQVTARNLASN